MANPYVNLGVEEMKRKLKEMRPKLTGRGSAILGGILTDLDRLKSHAQSSPEEYRPRCERGCNPD